ncbi:MAG TPA: M28 family peptidase [Vicinamibacterales bacterium]|nr:M28 family peptidase [Vicinamibacterales bacterium]
MTRHGVNHEGHNDLKAHKAFVVLVVLVSFVIPAAARCSAQPAPKFDGGRAYEDLRQMVAIGPRPAGSPAIEKTRDYIKKQLTAAGLKPEEQPFDAQTPIGVIHMVNIRATLAGPSMPPGTSQAHDRGHIVIGGHYDTKLFHEFPFVGASDGASSAAFLLEIARAFKGRVNRVPIELLFLDGEEAVRKEWDDKSTDHTYGSRYYVQQLQRAGAVKDVRAFILVDMIADRDLDIRREQYSTGWLTDAIWGAARRLNRPEFLDEATPIEDDHLEFLQAGIPSVDIIDLDYACCWHRPEDDLSHVAAGSLQAVGDVLIAALPAIERRLTTP